MIPHPRFAELNRYADRDLSDRRRGRVAAHLAGCTECRSTVIALRSMTAVGPQILNEKAPVGTLDKILERHARGESVILPVADPPLQRMPAGTVWRAAAAVVLAVATIVTVFTVQDVGAEFSTLTVSLVDPLDKSVEVEYQSTSMFTGEDRLVIRASYRVPGDELSNRSTPKVISAPIYRHEGGVFRGVLELPDSAVYVVFAVEDTAGRQIDSREGALWELLAESAGRPDYDALVQKQDDLSGRNWELALETARQATQLYPDKPQAWVRLSALERLGAGDSVRQALRERHAAKFAQLERDLSGEFVSDEQVAGMYSYAMRALPGSDRFDYWRDRLFSQAPYHPLAVQARVQQILRTRSGSPSRGLQELETLWREVGPVHPQLPLSGMYLALETRAPSTVLRWADRLQQMQPWITLDIAEQLTAIPALRNEATAKLRDELTRLDNISSPSRALQLSAREHRIRVNALRRRALASLGKVLIDMRKVDAALDTLNLAVADGWNVTAFDAMAEAKLAVGDTADAVTMLAYVSVDPNTSAASATVLAKLGSEVLGTDRWETLLQNARAEMYRRSLAESSKRPVRREVELVGPDGSRSLLEDITVGRVTMVTFWARYCGPCLEQLPLLEQVADRIRVGRSDDDVYALIVTGEEPSVDLREFVAQRQITVPVFHDVNRSAHRALGSWETPSYFLLDRAGLVRFSGSELHEIERQVDALLSEDRR